MRRIMSKAMYAFSGDPITFGHIDIIKRAAKTFDCVIVGIGVNPNKKYTFTLEERTKMAEQTLDEIPNVKVISFNGLLVDCAYEHNIDVIVKGVRNATDFDYEQMLHQIGESQNLDIDTHILFARPHLAHISSSAVKAIQEEHGMIHGLVPLHVKERLEDRISGQHIIGVTGEIGAGKSYVCQRFVELGKQRGIQVHNIELDHIGHQILGGLNEPHYEKIRTLIANEFGKQLKMSDGSIDRKALGEVIFGNNVALEKLNSILRDPIQVRIRKELQGKKGIICFNAALIAESDIAHVCNNNVLMITVDKNTQETRLKERGLTPDQIRRRLQSQWNHSEKRKRIQAAIDRDSYGQLWFIDNSEQNYLNNTEIEYVFSKILKELNIT